MYCVRLWSAVLVMLAGAGFCECIHWRGRQQLHISKISYDWPIFSQRDSIFI